MSLRIVSLLPAATEIVFLLGLEKYLVGVSHDSDYPAYTQKIPKLTQSNILQKWSSKEIDSYVRKSKHTGISVFHIDEALLKKLRPNLILTQELCAVCAPSYSHVEKAAKVLKGDTSIVSLEPESIDDILENIRLVARLTDRETKAETVEVRFRTHIQHIKDKISSSQGHAQKSVMILEWFDPLMIAAHWVPEMVEIAGGKAILAKKGERSRRTTWQKVVDTDPDILILAPCGFSIKRAEKELPLITQKPEFMSLKAVKNNTVFFLDGKAYLTRPGPRVIDGIEILAEIIHPHIFKRRYNTHA